MLQWHNCDVKKVTEIEESQTQKKPKRNKTGFGIIVKGLRGELSLPLPSVFVQTKKQHLNIFLGGKKNKQTQGSLRSLFWCPSSEHSPLRSHPLPCSLGQIQATLGVSALQDRGRRYKGKNDDRQTSSRARKGLVFCSCGAAFVSSLREGSAGSWLVSSEGQKKMMVSHRAEHRRLLLPQTDNIEAIKEWLNKEIKNVFLCHNWDFWPCVGVNGKFWVAIWTSVAVAHFKVRTDLGNRPEEALRVWQWRRYLWGATCPVHRGRLAEPCAAK